MEFDFSETNMLFLNKENMSLGETNIEKRLLSHESITVQRSKSIIELDDTYHK